MWMGDEDRDFSPMRISAGVTYAVSPIVTVALQGRYTTGRAPHWNWRNAFEGDGTDTRAATWNKDAAALYVSPYITFNVGPTIDIGYNLRKDMTKDAKASATVQTLTHTIYATVAISF